MAEKIITVPAHAGVRTAELQSAVDSCCRAGGGTLVFQAGVHETGTLTLGDNLTIILEKDAVLAGSGNPDDYPLFAPSPVPFQAGRDGIRTVLFALGKKNITLRGEGTIDGRNRLISYSARDLTRPRVIWFGQCDNVEVSGVTLLNGYMWMQHYIQCRAVTLSGLTVRNHGCWNNDGIDIDSCSGVLIEKCRVDSADDAICLKSGTVMPCCDVTIRDCVTSSYFAHFKLGTESNGGFRNIRCSKLRMIPSERSGVPHGDYRGTNGIAIGEVDGGSVDDVEISDVTMEGVRMPLLMRLGDRRRGVLGEPDGGTAPAFFRSVRVRNVLARHADPFGCYICGLKAQPIQDVRLENVRLEFSGPVPPYMPLDAVPEAEKIAPCPSTFGNDAFPAYLYRRYAEIKLDEVEIQRVQGDSRPAVN